MTFKYVRVGKVVNFRRICELFEYHRFRYLDNSLIWQETACWRTILLGNIRT